MGLVLFVCWCFFSLFFLIFFGLIKYENFSAFALWLGAVHLIRWWKAGRDRWRRPGGICVPWVRFWGPFNGNGGVPSVCYPGIWPLVSLQAITHSTDWLLQVTKLINGPTTPISPSQHHRSNLQVECPINLIKLEQHLINDQKHSRNIQNVQLAMHNK